MLLYPLKHHKHLYQLYEIETGALNLISKKIANAKSNLRSSFNGYFQDLVMQVQGTSLETIGDFLVREIGNEGSSGSNDGFGGGGASGDW